MRIPRSCSTCKYCHSSGYCKKNDMDVNYAVATGRRGIFCPFECDTDWSDNNDKLAKSDRAEIVEFNDENTGMHCLSSDEMAKLTAYCYNDAIAVEQLGGDSNGIN